MMVQAFPDSPVWPDKPAILAAEGLWAPAQLGQRFPEEALPPEFNNELTRLSVFGYMGVWGKLKGWSFQQ
jgi:hypothetical protein